jgi:hypothetical protein
MLGLFTLLLLVGCSSSGPVRDINDPTNSLIFGYIDWMMRQQKPPRLQSCRSLLHPKRHTGIAAYGMACFSDHTFQLAHIS